MPIMHRVSYLKVVLQLFQRLALTTCLLPKVEQSQSMTRPWQKVSVPSWTKVSILKLSSEDWWSIFPLLGWAGVFGAPHKSFFAILFVVFFSLLAQQSVFQHEIYSKPRITSRTYEPKNNGRTGEDVVWWQKCAEVRQKEGEKSEFIGMLLEWRRSRIENGERQQVRDWGLDVWNDQYLGHVCMMPRSADK